MKTRFTVHPKPAHWHAQPFSPLWAGLARDKSQHALELIRRNAEKGPSARRGRQPSSGSVHSCRVICPTVPSGVPGFLRPSPGVLSTPWQALAAASLTDLHYAITNRSDVRPMPPTSYRDPASCLRWMCTGFPTSHRLVES